jgi:CubicO group peptidase (beta-lactamase class C family)
MPSVPFRRFVAAVAVTLLGCAAGCSAVANPPTAPGSPRSSQLSTPAKASTNYPAMVRELNRRIKQGPPELQAVRAVLASVDNTTVIADYPAGRYPASDAVQSAHVYSVTKSVTSVLVGIALDEGHLRSVDQTLGELLPKYRSKMTTQVAGITLRQLLTHTSGIPGNNSAGLGMPAILTADDGVASILTAPLLNDPGTVFDYSNLGAHLVTAVLAQATGRSVLDYARERLFDPLGIKTRPAYEEEPLRDATADQPTRDFVRAGFAWGTDRQGVNSGCCFLKLTAPDMVKIGELYLNRGVWHGRRIVSADWVRDSTAPQVTPDQLGPDGGYGYFWWRGEIRQHRAFFAQGSYGQLVAVFPDLKLVIAVSTRDHGGVEDINLDPLVDVVFSGVAR